MFSNRSVTLPFLFGIVSACSLDSPTLKEKDSAPSDRIDDAGKHQGKSEAGSHEPGSDGVSGAGGAAAGGTSGIGDVSSSDGSGGSRREAGVGGVTQAGGTSGDRPDASADAAGAPDSHSEAGTLDACVPVESTTFPAIPEIIQVPQGVTLYHHFHASGTQTSTCVASDGMGIPTYAYGAAIPDATLYDSCGTPVIHHSAGPTWQWLADGSGVSGTRLQSSGVAGSIPQLLLKASAHTGNGVMSAVTYIQRLGTNGGAPPAAGCTAANVNSVAKVPYEADYYFYEG